MVSIPRSGIIKLIAAKGGDTTTLGPWAVNPKNLKNLRGRSPRPPSTSELFAPFEPFSQPFYTTRRRQAATTCALWAPRNPLNPARRRRAILPFLFHHPCIIIKSSISQENGQRSLRRCFAAGFLAELLYFSGFKEAFYVQFSSTPCQG